MSVSRKENGSLVRKAGLGIVDNILNKFSHNAISNSAVTEAITEINNDLSELRRNIMPVLDFANPLYTFSTNHLSYTATQDCYLFGSLYTGDYTLKIDNTEVLKFICYSSATHCQQIPVLKLSAGQKVEFTELPSSYCNIHIYREISL